MPMMKFFHEPTAFPRRYFLAEGTRLMAMGGLGAMLAGLGLPGEAAAQDWLSLLRGRREGGHGIVKKLVGRASATGRALQVGSRVESGEQVRVAGKSWMILSLSDNTILRANGEARFSLEISTRRTGLFRLLVGSLLAVMPRGNRYLVAMPTTTVGIKGTVFFHQIYHPDERLALDPNGKPVSIPPGIGEYFCLCNGQADFMRSEFMQGDEARGFFSDDSIYHNSYYIDPRRENPLVKAPQLNHTDEQILELIDRQDGPKHDSRWIDSYRSGYDEEDSGA